MGEVGGGGFPTKTGGVLELGDSGIRTAAFGGRRAGGPLGFLRGGGLLVSGPESVGAGGRQNP